MCVCQGGGGGGGGGGRGEGVLKLALRDLNSRPPYTSCSTPDKKEYFTH